MKNTKALKCMLWLSNSRHFVLFKFDSSQNVVPCQWSQRSDTGNLIIIIILLQSCLLDT